MQPRAVAPRTHFYELNDYCPVFKVTADYALETFDVNLADIESFEDKSTKTVANITLATIRVALHHGHYSLYELIVDVRGDRR